METQTAVAMQVRGAVSRRVVSSACHFTCLDTNRSEREAGVHPFSKAIAFRWLYSVCSSLNGNRREITRLLYFN